MRRLTADPDTFVVPTSRNRFQVDVSPRSSSGSRLSATISPREHRQIALDFLAASDEEVQRGDALQGAEKLCGAAAQSIMSVAQERDWPHQSHRALKNAATRLADERRDPLIASNFAVAGKFHVYFYHGIMEDWERDADRPSSTT